MNPKLHVNGPLAWSAAGLLAIVVLIVITLPALARAALGPDLPGTGVDDDFARLMEEHEAMTMTYQDRFDGRSVFFKPPRKPKPVVRRTPPPRPKDNGPKTPPPPPPPPSRPVYAGPAIGGIIGDRVYFNGDLRVGIGEERDGLEVMKVNAPWGATVKYRGWEYDLSLFEHAGFFEDEVDETDMTLGGFIEEDAVDAGDVEDVEDEASTERGVAVPAASANVRGRSRAKPRTVDE